MLPVSKKYIAKSNDFINARKKMSAAQRNLLNALLTRVKMNSRVEFLDFTLHELSEILGVKVTNYEQFRELFRSMKMVTMDKVEVDGITIDSLLGPAKFSHSNMAVRFYFTPLANEHFVDLRGKAYTKQLLRSSLFRSVYSHELWDLLSSIKNKQDKSIIISLEDLRLRFQLNPQTYPTYSQFRVKTLDPAIENINNVTGMTVDYSVMKVGRSVGYLKFEIKSISEEELGRYKEPELFPKGSIPSIVNTPDQGNEDENNDAKIHKLYSTLVTEFNFTHTDALMLSSEGHQFIPKLIYEIRNKRNTPNEIQDPKKFLLQGFYYGSKNK